MTENLEQIWKLVHEDCHQRLHELANTDGSSSGVCQKILTEHIDVKFVPWLLKNDQKQWCINVYLGLWEKANKDPTIITLLLCFPNWKWNWRDVRKSAYHPNGIARNTQQHYRKLLPQCFCSIEKRLASLYTFQRGYFEGKGSQNSVS
jgi:hypothetical protein